MAFEYPTNFSNGTVVDGLGSWFVYSNYLTEGFFATGLLFIIALMSFVVGFIGGNANKAFLFSGFVSFVFAVFFVRLEMLNLLWVFVPILMIIGGGLATKSDEGRI